MAEGAEATPNSKFWSLVGGVSGGAMGFIVANVPGALAGAVAGNRLGAVRDARGKSVYSVFQEYVSYPELTRSVLMALQATAKSKGQIAERIGCKGLCACSWICLRRLRWLIGLCSLASPNDIDIPLCSDRRIATFLCPWPIVHNALLSS